MSCSACPTIGQTIHVFHNPAVPRILLSIVVVFGGLLSLSRRRGTSMTTKRVLDLRSMLKASIGVPIRYGLPALALLALMGFFFWRLNQTATGNTPNLVPSEMIDKPAPAFDLPPLHRGQPGFKATDLRGHVTLVNFFASWCVPCRAEHPALQRLTGSGIMLVGINYKDKAENAQAFLAELGNPYRVIAADTSGRVGTDFGVYGVPESYLIDKNGVIRYRQTGPLTDSVVFREVLSLAQKLK